MLASVIVSNYNYGQFLRAALDSALGQTIRPEVLTVDDGSTDDSRDIIASYGTAVVAVLKDNGGQASAFNAGFERASGDVVIFLDADDVLLPGAVERVLEECADRNVAKAHWQMIEMGKDGKLGDDRVPREALSQGYLADTIVSGGPSVISNPPTSGNAWNRRFLNQIFPLPTLRGADGYMGTLAPMYGRVVGIEEPLSAYRRHDDSNFAAKAFDVRLAIQRAHYDHYCEALERVCRERGIAVDRARWDDESWICQVEDMVRALHRHVPPGQPFILIDDNQFDMDETEGRPAIQLIAKDGVYWGLPEDEAAAISALDAHVENGIEFLALAPDSRWWLEEYPGLFRHLSRRADAVVDDRRLTLYRIRRA